MSDESEYSYVEDLDVQVLLMSQHKDEADGLGLTKKSASVRVHGCGMSVMAGFVPFGGGEPPLDVVFDMDLRDGTPLIQLCTDKHADKDSVAVKFQGQYVIAPKELISLLHAAMLASNSKKGGD